METTSTFPFDNLSKFISSLKPIPSDCVRAIRLVDCDDYIFWKPSLKDDKLSPQTYEFEMLDQTEYIFSLKYFDLRPGLRFLNIGSGSGYFNTVVGLILGHNGTNHGVELSGRNIQGALECLHEFMSKTDAPLERDFCVPRFVHGNIFSLFDPVSEDGSLDGYESCGSSGRDIANLSDDDDVRNLILPQFWFKRVLHKKDHNTADVEVELYRVSIGPPPLVQETSNNAAGSRWPMYDRIFVGASLRNRKQLKSILRLLTIGGILITIIRRGLVKITRFSENVIAWRDLFLAHARLIESPIGVTPVILPLKTEVPSLVRLSGRILRSILRRIIEQRYNGVPVLGPVHAKAKARTPISRVAATCSDVRSPMTLPSISSAASDTRDLSRVSCNGDSILQMFVSEASAVNGEFELGETDRHFSLSDEVNMVHSETRNVSRRFVEGEAIYEASDDGEYEVEPENSVPSKKNLFDHPASYYYRDEMSVIMSEELHLPHSLIQAAFLL